MKKLLAIWCCFLCFSVFAQESDASDENSEVAFATIENVPVYPGCHGEGNSELKQCMSDKISTFVGLHFNQGVVKSLDLPVGRNRIFVRFKIDKLGNVVDVKARATHPELEMKSSE